MIKYFRQLEIFKALSDEELSLLEHCSSVKTYNTDDVILGHSSTKRDLYIILSGRVLSTLKLPGTLDRKFGELVSGDFFGESSVFGNLPLFNTYTAADKAELLIINEKGFSGLIEKNPAAATKLISVLLSGTIRQFRKSSGFLAQVVQWGENASRRTITDELTGIYNRAFLDDAVESFFNISKSNYKPVSLLMLDVDNCRKINETLDHETGNRVICEFAAIIKNIISRQGIIARYGGDEFSILLPETNREQALAIAEEIRRTVDDYDFSGFLKGNDIKITTSIGVSSFPETATELEAFRTKADDSLYRAKEQGKNRIACVD
ncbi:MAG TPA: GGDEF domain-containing protein [Spirochaetota bacterium]|nr:GGDEF domain-containing protein [Spirochaetota bacterium]